MDTLQPYKDKPLFEVPEHYFEQLQQDVMQRVKKETKSQKIKKQWFSAISVAASIALILALSYFIFLNRDSEPHFYVHEEILPSEDSIISLDSNSIAEAIEMIATNDTAEQIITSKPLFSKAPLVPVNETIVYRAVDYYVDDFLTENFYETMYDLESYFDY